LAIFISVGPRMIRPMTSGEGTACGERTSAPAPMVFGLNRMDLAIHEIVWVTCMTTFFGSPVIVLWILEPKEWRAWLLFMLVAMVAAALVNSTPRAIHAWLRRRPPVVIGADGISLGFRETIPWSAVAGLFVDEETLKLKLTAEEMQRRGWDPIQQMADRRVDFEVPLDWVDAEPGEIMVHARPFLSRVAGDG